MTSRTPQKQVKWNPAIRLPERKRLQNIYGQQSDMDLHYTVRYICDYILRGNGLIFASKYILQLVWDICILWHWDTRIVLLCFACVKIRLDIFIYTGVIPILAFSLTSEYYSLFGSRRSRKFILRQLRLTSETIYRIECLWRPEQVTIKRNINNSAIKMMTQILTKAIESIA